MMFIAKEHIQPSPVRQQRYDYFYPIESVPRPIENHPVALNTYGSNTDIDAG